MTYQEHVAAAVAGLGKPKPHHIAAVYAVLFGGLDADARVVEAGAQRWLQEAHPHE